MAIHAPKGYPNEKSRAAASRLQRESRMAKEPGDAIGMRGGIANRAVPIADGCEHEEAVQREAIDNGLKIEVGDSLPSLEYVRQAAEVAGFTPAIKKLGGQGNPAQIASAIELVLEGLHLNRKLNKDRSATRMRYRS